MGQQVMGQLLLGWVLVLRQVEGRIGDRGGKHLVVQQGCIV